MMHRSRAVPDPPHLGGAHAPPPEEERAALKAIATFRMSGNGYLIEQNTRPQTIFYEVDKGGHFAAWEEPELFATEIRTAFKPLR
jgi:pimeloyl-ACP methyl ester carboxylesterase